MPSPSVAARALRSDARRNRTALLRSAQEAFAANGLDTALEGIARAAGVSVGTLYRHFPTRLDLVRAVFEDRLQTLLAAAEAAARMPDAWTGFCRYVEATCDMQSADRGFGELACIRLPLSPCIDAVQARIHALGVTVVKRAQQQGTLRGDVTAEDLAFITWSQAQIARATSDIAPSAWRRHLNLMFDAFRADRATSLDEPPLTPSQVYQAMVRLGGAGACGGAPADTPADIPADAPADTPADRLAGEPADPPADTPSSRRAGWRPT